MTRIVIDPDKLDRFSHTHELIAMEMSKQFASDAMDLLNMGRHVLGFMSDTGTYNRLMREQADIAAHGLQVISGVGSSVVDLRGYVLKVRAAEVGDAALGTALAFGQFAHDVRRPIHTSAIAKDAKLLETNTKYLDVDILLGGGKASVVTQRFSDGSTRVTVNLRGEAGRAIAAKFESGDFEAKAGVFGAGEMSWDLPDEDSARRLEWALAANLGGHAVAGLPGAVVAGALLPIPLPNRVGVSSGGYVRTSGSYGASGASGELSVERGASISKNGSYVFARVAGQISGNVGVEGWPRFAGTAEGKIEVQVKEGLASEVIISFAELPEVSHDVGMLHVSTGERMSAEVKVDLAKVSGSEARAALDAWRADPVGGVPMLEKLVAKGGPGITAEYTVSKVTAASLTPLDTAVEGKGPITVKLGASNEQVVRRVELGGTNG